MVCKPFELIHVLHNVDWQITVILIVREHPGL